MIARHKRSATLQSHVEAEVWTRMRDLLGALAMASRDLEISGERYGASSELVQALHKAQKVMIPDRPLTTISDQFGSALPRRDTLPPED